MPLTLFSRQAPDWYVKQGDRSPSIAFQLLDGNGVAINLAAATVSFIMWAPGAAAAKVNAAATITDAPTGKVSYAWAAVDTDTPGDYMAEWEVTFSGGYKETFPNSGWLKVRILDDIA